MDKIILGALHVLPCKGFYSGDHIYEIQVNLGLKIAVDLREAIQSHASQSKSVSDETESTQNPIRRHASTKK